MLANIPSHNHLLRTLLFGCLPCSTHRPHHTHLQFCKLLFVDFTIHCNHPFHIGSSVYLSVARNLFQGIALI